MLKMGQMCHCGATIKKWNAAGDLLWRLRRGAPPSGNRVDYAMYVDHAGDLLHAGGSLVAAEDEGVLYQYSDLSSPGADWRSDRNGFTETAMSAGSLTNRPKIVMGTDGFLTILAGQVLQRYDPANGDVLATATVSGGGFTKLLQGPSGDAFVHSPQQITSGVIKRYDTSLAETHSYNSGGFIGFGDASIIDGSSIAICQTNKLAVFDNTFTQLRSIAVSVQRIANNGSTAYVYSPTGPSFKKYDLSGITLTWTNSTMQLTGSGYTAPSPGPQNILMAIDASNSLYDVVEKSGAVSKIQKRQATDGSILWETDIGTSKLQDMRGLWVNEAAGLVVAIGRWYHGAATTDPRHIIALNVNDGSELWTARHGDPTTISSGFHDVSIDDDGNVYASGFDA